MHSSGSIIKTYLEKLRHYLDDPDLDAKYDDNYLVRFFLSSAMTDVIARVSMMADNQIMCLLNVSVVSGTTYYKLPPAIKQVLRIGIQDPATGWFIEDFKPRNEFSLFGPGWALEGNLLSFRPTPSQAQTYLVLYVPSGDVAAHYGTGTLNANNTFTLAPSPTIGSLDKRDNAYAGSYLRIFGTNLIDELLITSYDPVTRVVQLRNPPANATGPTYTYEVIPFLMEPMTDAISLSAAMRAGVGRKISNAQLQALSFEYKQAIKTAHDTLGNMNARIGKRFTGTVDPVAGFTVGGSGSGATTGTCAPCGSAGGDLGGSYPNPTVDGLQGRAVSAVAPTNGQVLAWDGSSWAPAAAGGGGVSDGDKGDVTVSGSGSTWTIDNDAVTFAKMQNVKDARIIGRESGAGTGDAKEIRLDSQFVWTTISGEPALTLSIPSDATKVNTSTQVNVGTGLTGGGDLSANRTISVATNGITTSLIADANVTFAKMQAVSANVLLGNDATGTVVEEIACTAAGRAILDDADAAAQRTTLGAAASTSSFITIGDETTTYPNSRYFASSATVSLNLSDAGQFKVVRGALTGDVTAPSNSATTTIANDAVTYAKMQNVSAASRLLGRGSAAGSGDVEEITLGTGLSMSGTTLSSSSGSTVTINEYTYTSSGSYTKPTGLKYIIVEGVGGGGGGGAGSTTAGGNGGCAGLYATVVIHEALITTSTLTVTIGTGGGAGVQGGDSEVTLASGGARLLYMPGGRAATNDMRNLSGGVTTGGFGAGQTAANATAGRHGGYGPGGGGPGQTNTTGAGLAGGRPSSFEFSGGNAQTGGGAAGGANGGGAGTNATVTVRGFGEGAGGGGANNAGAGGAGGNGTQGSGGGGGGRGSTAGGAGGSGGDGYIRIIEVVVT